MSKNTNTVIVKDGKTYLVSNYKIIGTREWRVEVYEPTTIGQGGHTTITSEFGKWWGSITSRALPTDINAIPVGPVRWNAIKVLRAERIRELDAVARETMTLPKYSTDDHRLCYTR